MSLRAGIAQCTIGLTLAIGLLLSPSPALAQKFEVKQVTEKRLKELPSGTLYWQIEDFPTLAQAEAAAGPWSLAVEAAGKNWLFTLGPIGGSSPGAVTVAEVGPIARVTAAKFLLRINEASGPPGSITAIHSHPGSEAFFVLAGEQSIRQAKGVLRIKQGQAEAGRGADHAMQVSSSGSTDLRALVMFVVDADKPFSVPAALH